jgi:LysM repeat protein
MRRDLVVIGLIAAALLAGCQQSGRPRTQAATPNPPAFGQIVEGSYIVAPGDTLAVAAKRTNTPIRTLIDLNGLQPPYRLRGGEKLALQPRIEYVVQSGDNIHLIALSRDVSPSALIQLNGLSAPYQLTPGQTLILPSDRDVPQSAPPPAPSAPGEIAAGSLAPIAGTASDSAG